MRHFKMDLEWLVKIKNLLIAEMAVKNCSIVAIKRLINVCLGYNIYAEVWMSHLDITRDEIYTIMNSLNPDYYYKNILNKKWINKTSTKVLQILMV